MKNSSGVDLFDTSASGNSNTMAIKTAIPVGPLSATVGYTSDNTASATNNTFGISTSMAAGNGTLSVAYVSSDNQTADVTQASAKYATTVGSASVAIGSTADNGLVKLITDAADSYTRPDFDGVRAFVPSGSAGLFFDEFYPAYTKYDSTNNRITFIVKKSATGVGGNVTVKYHQQPVETNRGDFEQTAGCLLYTSPSPRDRG